MRRIKRLLNRLPLKYRMMLISSCMLLLLVLLSSIVQYVMLDRLLMRQEEDSIRRTMADIQAHFQEKEPSLTAETIKNTQPFLYSMQQPDQMLRILDPSGKPVIILTDNHLPDKWVKPQPVTETRLSSYWHETEHLLVMRSPLSAGTFNGTVEIVRNLNAFDRMENAVLTVLAVSGVGAIAISVFGALYLVRQLLDPIRSVINTMQRIRLRGFHQRVEVPEQRDELAELAVMFNMMMDQVENALKQQQQFVEDASHELRTPIAILEGHLTLLNRWGKDDPAVLNDSLKASLEELKRLKDLVMELLELTRLDAADHSREAPVIAPEEVILNWLPHFQTIHQDFTFDVHLEDWKGVSIRILPRHLEQITAILLDNAVKYSPGKKQITVEGEALPQYLELRIKDHGIGIPEGDMPHVFRRFYRADKARSREMGGSGLGLAIADRLVRLYGGSIQLESVEGEGTQVTIRLPRPE